MSDLRFAVGEDAERIQECLTCEDVISACQLGDDFHVTCSLFSCKSRQVDWGKWSNE